VMSVSKRIAGLICLSGVGLFACMSQDALRSSDFEQTMDIGSKASAEGGGEDAELVYLLLSAEMAGQRGQSGVALDNYLKAAELSHDPRVAARAVQVALFVKDNAKLQQAAALWRTRDPASPDARRLSVLLELKAGHMDAAREQLAALLSMPEVDLDSTLLDLVKLLDAEVPQEQAFALMSSLTQQFPDSAEVHLAYAALAGSKGKLEIALDEIERSLALHPDWGRARLLQAQVMAQMGHTDAAGNALVKALKADPDNLRLRLFYAQFLARGGDFKGASHELDRILAKNPGDEDALFTRALIWLESGDMDKARQSLIPLVKSSAWKEQASFYLGLADARQNRLQAALEWFDRVESGPKLFDARINAVTAAMKLGQQQEARQRLIRLRKEFPAESLRLYLLEAELLSSGGDANGSFDVLTQALEAHPGQTDLLYARALVAEHLGRLEVVEADLRAVLEKNPDDANALNALGFTLADHYPERLNEAKTLIVRANEVKPGEPAILDSLGWVNYRMGNYDEAIAYLREAFARMFDPEIGAHLGEALWESGQRREAQKIWAQVLKKAPQHQAIKAIKLRYPEAFNGR
jgi:Flp pilus assembly protein TadD